MSYVPPHLRNNNKKKDVEKPVPKQDEFPSLGFAKTKSQFMPTRSFASLANEWSEESEIQKQQEEYRKAVEEREFRRQQGDLRKIIKFNKTTEISNSDYPEELESTEQTTDGWTTVSHTKVRRELTVEEKLEREIAREEEEKRMNDQESMWNQSAGDDWDYRDRRTL